VKKLFLLCYLTLVLFGDVSYETAYTKYKAGKYQEALKEFKTLANQEQDYDAAYILGYMYEHGEGCQISPSEAMYYYKIASRGYYLQRKEDPARDSKKEQKKIFETIDDLNDSQTYNTIKQYAQSLYNIKAYKANYFLPVSYRYGGEYTPVGDHDMKSTEIEFQVSIRYDFATNLLGMHEIYTFAYTQKSFWQAYAQSAYFRESNYNPEFFATIPVGTKHIKALKFGVAHQSNGRGGSDERSWNYASGSAIFQTGLLFTEFKLWYRFDDKIDYNPDLIKYMGYGHLKFVFPYKKHLMKLLLRSNFSGKSAAEFSYSYPMFGSNDLFFYLKTFNGYGESLIDFDNKIDKVGVGFSISR